MSKSNNKGDGGSEKKTASVTVVLKVNMHCDGCASKMVKTVRAFQGVETVKAESETGKVTVTGDVDPAKLREQLEVQAKKKVELVSSQPNKDNNNKNSKDKKTEEKKPKEAPVTTVVLKVDFHCDGCIDKIQKTVSKTKGVSGLSLDKEKQLVTVKGTMNVKKLTDSLAEKLKRNVEILQPAKKDKEKESGDNKQGGGGGGKDNAGNKGGEGVNMMEYVAAQPAHGSVHDSDGDDQYPGLKLFSDDNPNNCVVM